MGIAWTLVIFILTFGFFYLKINIQIRRRGGGVDGEHRGEEVQVRLERAVGRVAA